MQRHLNHAFIVLVGLSSVALALPATVQDAALQYRQAAAAPQQCTDLMATVDDGCWNALGIPDWLNSWYPNTKCKPDAADDAACCNDSEAWSTCFLRLNQPTSGSDCTQIDSCNTYVPTIQADASVAAQVHYVVYNIYKINHFFTTWYYATLFGKSQASDQLTNIVNTIDPPDDSTVAFMDILAALTAGLAFLSLPAASAIGAGITAETKTSSQVLITALGQAPGVSRAVWPAGDNTQSYQFGQLSDALGDITDAIRENINNGLNNVMTDVSAFQAFAANGAFSGPTPPSLQNETTGMEWGFTTFLVSKALYENGWDATFTTKDKVGDLDDSGNPDPSLWWCSPSGSNFCFFLNKSLDNNHGSSDNILSKVINTGWTTGDLLFDDALTCLQEGKNNSVPVSLNGNSLDLNCLSRTFICSSHPEEHDNPVDCPVAFVNGACPYPACRG